MRHFCNTFCSKSRRIVPYTKVSNISETFQQNSCLRTKRGTPDDLFCMKLQQLKYLLAIADNGLNITAAAERLYTSQPGVSKQLKLLEEELGLQLFARKGKSLEQVTGAGRILPPDLGGTASTAEMVAAICAVLEGAHV